LKCSNRETERGFLTKIVLYIGFLRSGEAVKRVIKPEWLSCGIGERESSKGERSHDPERPTMRENILERRGAKVVRDVRYGGEQTGSGRQTQNGRRRAKGAVREIRVSTGSEND
jgi:hypothetical protein